LANRNILVVGDSLSCEPGTPPGLGYPAYLRAMLPPSSTVTTMAWGGFRTDWLYAAVHAAIIGGTWTDVVALCGVNDMTADRTAIVAVDWMNKIYADVETIHARLTGIELTPWSTYVNANPARLAQAVIYNTYLHQHLNPWKVINTHSMGDGSWALLPAYDFGDHLHMTPAGQQYLADLVYAGLQ
jgi:lysophospholipase L1-like esterase